MAGGQVNIGIGFSVDKSGLSQMQSLFQQIANSAKEPGNQLNTGLQQAAATANKLDAILEKTFNTNLGTLNVTKFNQELSKSGMTLKSVQADLSKAGNQGATAYNRLSQAILGTNLQLKQSNKLLDSMATTMANTVKWGITSSIFNTITNSIQKAYSYSKQLNTSLNDIRIVTDKSADSMERFAEQANEAAKGMGASTLDYTNAALIYYQQGLTDSEVQARAETTIKAANVTGQTGEEVSEQLTAVWNGYKVTAEETEAYVDKLAAVAATTAADLEELSVGMSKVAAAANSMGVDFDDLNAQIATIVSVTRQAPESVGTALKTIYARLGDLKVDGVDEFGVKLGEVSAQMQTMGIQILDQNGDLRDMSSVIAEVAQKWTGWTEAQRQAAAVAMAGKRQYNNLIALFDNWDMYTDALNTSVEAVGTLQHQQDIYMESTAAKLKILKATWQDLYDGIIDDDELNTGIEGLTNLVQVFDNFIDSFGGGIKSISAFGAVVANIFNKQISDAINTAYQNQQKYQQNLDLLTAKQEMIENGTLQSTGSFMRDAAIEVNTQRQLDIAKEIYDVRAGLTNEEYNNLTVMQQKIGLLAEEQEYTKLSVVEAEKEILDDKEIIDLLTKENSEVEKIKDKKLDEYNVSLKNLEIEEKKLDSLEKQIQKAINYNATEKSLGGYKSQILQKANAIGEAEGKVVQKILENVKNVTDLKRLKTEILRACSSQVDKESEIVSKVEEELSAQERVLKGREKIAVSKEQELNLENQINQTVQNAGQSQNIVQNITTITSALSAMAMAWSSVNSLIQTWNNESASFGDKIVQTFMTLGISLPIVISSFNKLKDVFGISSSLLDVYNAKQAVKIALDKAEVLNNTARLASFQAFINGRQKEITTILEEVSAEELEAIALGKETALRTAYNLNKRTGNTLTREEVVLLSKLIAARAGDTAAMAAEKTASDALNSSLLKNPYTIILAAIVAVTAAIAGVVKIIDKQREKQKELAEENLKEIKAIEDQANANKELVDTFGDLFKQYNELKDQQETDIFLTQDLREVTLKLAEAYDIAGASLLAMGGYYDVLNNKIKEARENELNEIIEKAAQGAKEASTSAAINMTSGKGYMYNNIYHLNGSRSRAYNDTGEIQRLSSAISNLGLEGENYFTQDWEGGEEIFKLNIDIDTTDPEDVRKKLSDINSIIEYYQTKYKGNREVLNNDYYYNLFLDEQKQYSEQFEELTSQFSTLYSTEIEKAFNKIDYTELDSLEEIYNKIEEVKSELVETGKVPEDQIDNYVKNAIKDIDELQDSVDKLDLAERLSEKTGQEIPDILNVIKNFNDSDLSLIELHIDEVALSNDIQKWVDDHSPLIMETELMTTSDKLQNALSNYDEKKGFKEEDLNSVFSQGNIEEVIGMSTQDFGAKDAGDQLQILTEAWIKSVDEIIKKKQDLLDTLKEEQTEYQKQLDAQKDGNKELEESFINIIGKSENLKNQQNELKQALQDLAANGYEGLKNEQKALINLFEEQEGSSRELSESLGEHYSTISNLDNILNGLEAQINNINETEKNYAKNIEFINQVESLHSAILDDIQSAYQSLTSIVDNYNETGEWTIDNVQKLISMDDAYVATLQFENGQLSINEQSFQAMTLAKLDDLEASVDLEYQEKMLAIANKDEALSAAAAAAASIAAASDMATMGSAALSAAEGVQILADTLKQIGDPDSDYAALAEQTEKAWENRKKAIEDARKNVKKGGSSFKRTMGAGKSSKGGGGGKERQEKELKNLDDEFDRYWEIKKAIDAVALALKRLAKDQKNLYGTQLIDSLKIQNNLLEQQKAHYDALWEAQEQEAAELRAQLGTMGLVFDASGAITNYAAATTQALADYNAAIQQYNAGLIDDTALQVYEKSYENFKKLLERYDTLYYKEIQDTIDKIDDLHREQLTNNLKAWEVKIELKLNLKELKRGWIDFIKEINEDFQKVYKDLRVEAQRLKDDAKTYIGDDGGVATTINAIHDVTAEIDKMQAGGTSTMFESISQAQEKLKELNDTLQDNAKGLHDLWKAAWDNYLDGIDEVSDRFEDLMDQFERMDDELEFQGQLIELLYGEKAYEMMDKLYKGQERSLGNQVQSVKTQMDMWERLWRESGATMENQSSWTEDQKKYYDEWTSAQSKLNDLVIDYIKLLKDDYLNTIEKILTELERGLTGSSLADMKTEWERITEYSDKYLDDVEQAYEAQKLANKIDEEIAKTNDVKKQQKLQAFRDKEIKYLREKEHLTQYDLDAAEARYQIALKEMALEDARNNKTSMKLVRNEQGNWSYQYLADEEETASKQQELLDAYNDLYQLASDAYEANLETLQTLQEKYLESAKEIYEDETLSEEEKEQKLLKLRQWYFQQYALLAEENTLYRNDLATSAAALLLEIYNEDEEAYQAMTDTERQLVDDLVSANIDDYMDLENKMKDNYKNIGDASKVLMSDTRKDWNSSAQQIADNWINSSNNVRSEVLSAHAQIQQATDDYQAKVDWVAAAVERDFGPDGITGAIWEASYATDDLKDTTIDLVNESIPYLESLKQAVDEIEAAWNSVKDAIEAAIAELERYISLEAHYAQQQAENRAKEAAAQAAEAAKSSSGSGSGSGSGGSGGGSFSSRSDFIIAGNKNGQDIGNITGRTFASYEDALKYLNSGRVQSTNYNNLSYSIRRADRSAFATGGYTGSWNGGDTDGRLAVLHQKELVLNKEDTSNFLSGIQMLRDMSATNGSINKSIMQAVANMASSLGNIRANRLNGMTTVNETTENNGNIFNIQAEFPNANDANEIRQALLSLPNLASQYIARNGR